jgi:hypothetical protein
MKKSNQTNLFEELGVDEAWKEHWEDMPEYSSEGDNEAFMTATFKFKTQEDFDTFHSLLKEHLYDGARVFDGRQEKRKKNSWFPLKERPSEKSYHDE